MWLSNLDGFEPSPTWWCKQKVLLSWLVCAPSPHYRTGGSKQPLQYAAYLHISKKLIMKVIIPRAGLRRALLTEWQKQEVFPRLHGLAKGACQSWSLISNQHCSWHKEIFTNPVQRCKSALVPFGSLVVAYMVFGCKIVATRYISLSP